MSEHPVEQDVDYRPRLNPEFLRRARESQKKRAAQEAYIKAQQAKEARRREIEERRAKRVEIAIEISAEAMRPSTEVAENRLKSLIAALHERRPITVPQVREIIDAVAAKHGLQRAHILSNSRKRQIVKARHEAMLEARRLRPDMSISLLSRQFDRDHTTLLHALNKANAA